VRGVGGVAGVDLHKGKELVGDGEVGIEREGALQCAVRQLNILR
jgi:hypothetical protein